MHSNTQFSDKWHERMNRSQATNAKCLCTKTSAYTIAWTQLITWNGGRSAVVESGEWGIESTDYRIRLNIFSFQIKAMQFLNSLSSSWSIILNICGKHVAYTEKKTKKKQNCEQNEIISLLALLSMWIGNCLGLLDKMCITI